MCIYLQCDVHSFVAGGVSPDSIMALKIDVLQAANAMDALEVAIRAEHARMTIDDMLTKHQRSGWPDWSAVHHEISSDR